LINRQDEELEDDKACHQSTSRGGEAERERAGHSVRARESDNRLRLRQADAR